MDSSNIMYFKTDGEMDNDIQEENTCLSFCTKSKRLKQNECSNTEKINFQTKNIKSQLYRTRQNVSAYRHLKKSSSYATQVIKIYSDRNILNIS